MLENHRNKNFFTLASLVFALSLIALLSGCSGIQSSPGNPQNEIWGQVDTKNTDMLSKIPGYVDKMYVQQGQEVKAGQVLAHISSSDLKAKEAQVEAQVNAARAKAAQAKAGMEYAAKDMERLSELYKAGAISAQQYDGIKTKYQVAVDTYHEALAGVNAYEKGLQQVTANVNDTYIKSPMDGVIATKYVNQGALVSTGMPIYNVQSTKDNWINFKVPETLLGKFKIGDKVKVQGRNKDLTLEGTIVEISKKPDFATQRATSERGNAGDIISFNVKVQVNNPNIFPGMRFKLLGFSMNEGEK